eukprot:4198670-Prymnesium_polylepis.1
MAAPGALFSFLPPDPSIHTRRVAHARQGKCKTMCALKIMQGPMIPLSRPRAACQPPRASPE